jgi:hypothetical protein
MNSYLIVIDWRGVIKGHSGSLAPLKVTSISPEKPGSHHLVLMTGPWQGWEVESFPSRKPLDGPSHELVK